MVSRVREPLWGPDYAVQGASDLEAARLGTETLVLAECIPCYFHSVNSFIAFRTTCSGPDIHQEQDAM